MLYKLKIERGMFTNRLFGLLIISLTLLTDSIVLQVPWLILIVLILGILLLIPNSWNQTNEEKSV